MMDRRIAIGLREMEIVDIMGRLVGLTNGQGISVGKGLWRGGFIQRTSRDILTLRN